MITIIIYNNNKLIEVNNHFVDFLILSNIYINDHCNIQYIQSN